MQLLGCCEWLIWDGYGVDSVFWVVAKVQLCSWHS